MAWRDVVFLALMKQWIVGDGKVVMEVLLVVLSTRMTC